MLIFASVCLQLVTGSSLLSAVAENSAAESETTIDMVGREEAPS